MKSYLIALLLFWSSVAYAQPVIRSSDFLRSLREEATPPDDYTDRRRVRLPWIQAYEYRTETDRFEWERQEHVLRISPNTPGLRRAQSRLAEHYRAKRSVVEALYRHERIAAAYEAWKDLYVQEQQLIHYARLEAILADRLTLRQKQLQLIDADYKDVLDMRERLNETRIRHYESKLAAQRLRTQFGLDTTTTVVFDNMVSVDWVSLRLSVDTAVRQNPQLAGYRYERELIKREVDLEKAERWQLLDFLQVRYNGPRDELLEERVQLRAGFVLPTSASRNLKLEELRLEQEELRREQQVEEVALNREITELREATHDRIAVYQAFEKIKNEELTQLKAMAQAVAQRAGTYPDLLLKINEKTEDILLEKLARREVIYEDYLEYLALTGQLFAEPERNFLAE